MFFFFSTARPYREMRNAKCSICAIPNECVWVALMALVQERGPSERRKVNKVRSVFLVGKANALRDVWNESLNREFICFIEMLNLFAWASRERRTTQLIHEKLSTYSLSLSSSHTCTHSLPVFGKRLESVKTWFLIVLFKRSLEILLFYRRANSLSLSLSRSFSKLAVLTPLRDKFDARGLTKGLRFSYGRSKCIHTHTHCTHLKTNSAKTAINCILILFILLRLSSWREHRIDRFKLHTHTYTYEH